MVSITLTLALHTKSNPDTVVVGLIRATPAVCKNFLYSISIFTLSATLYLFLLQQYSLFHSLLYLNILFYYFTTFKYYIFYFSVLLFRTKNNQLPWRSEPKTTTNLSNQKPPWRSEGSTTSRPLGSARQGGSCFAAWWWLASVVTDLRREPRRGSLLGGGWPRWVQI
jgi:hypothetical protein